MVRAGTIALSAVDQLRAIAKVSPPLLDAVIDFLADGNEWAAERLAHEPGWVLDSALRQGDSKVSAAHLTQVDSYQLTGVKLGTKTEALYERQPRCTSSLTAAPTGRQRSGSPTPRSTRHRRPTWSSNSTADSR